MYFNRGDNNIEKKIENRNPNRIKPVNFKRQILLTMSMLYTLYITIRVAKTTSIAYR